MPKSKTTSEQKIAARPMRRVVVLGANGTMGYQSGALFAAAGVDVVFLARSKEKAEGGRRGAARAVRSSAIERRIEIDDYDALEKHVPDADLVFEAVAENFELKRTMYTRVDACRRDDAIVATVSSGLSITELADGLSESFGRHFAGLHFFNPPQVMVGTELVAGENTDSEVLDFLEVYSEKVLGRLMVRAANTPGFAGNRIGFKVLNEAAQLAEEHGPLLVDQLIGRYTGRALAPLATIDLVGWDVHKAIIDNVVENAENDEAIDTYRLPPKMAQLIEAGTLGTKSGGGYFKRGEKREKLVLEMQSGDYRPLSEVKLPELPFVREVVDLHRVGAYGEAMARFVAAKGPEARIAQRVLGGYISYAFHRVGEVSETLSGVDRIMAAGFNWAPPGALVDLIGLPETVQMMERCEVLVPPVLADALASGKTTRFFGDPRLSVGRYFVAR